VSLSTRVQRVAEAVDVEPGTCPVCRGRPPIREVRVAVDGTETPDPGRQPEPCAGCGGVFTIAYVY
jgi:hypothetical protein